MHERAAKEAKDLACILLEQPGIWPWVLRNQLLHFVSCFKVNQEWQWQCLSWHRHCPLYVYVEEWRHLPNHAEFSFEPRLLSGFPAVLLCWKLLLTLSAISHLQVESACCKVQQVWARGLELGHDRKKDESQWPVLFTSYLSVLVRFLPRTWFITQQHSSHAPWHPAPTLSSLDSAQAALVVCRISFSLLYWFLPI